MRPRIIIGEPTTVFSDTEFDFCYPGLTCLSNGDILCVARKLRDLSDPKGELVMTRSTDGGESFTAVPPPNTADASEHPEWGYLMGFVCEAAPGRLSAVYEYIETDESQPLFSPKTDGMQQAYIRCAVSNDNGLTWEPARDIGFRLPEIIVTGQPCVTPDGSIGFPTETHNVWEKSYVDGPAAWFIVSRDGGATYDEGFLMAADKGLLYGDARLTFDGDEMISYFWCYDMVNVCDKPVHKCVSHDSGRTWSKPQPLDLKMQISSPFFVKRGLTMCLAQDRFSEAPGLKAMLSYDEGQTWDESSSVCLYDAGSRPDGTNPFAQFDQYTFGYSSLRKRGDNEAMCVYWHVSDGRKVVSVNKIQVDY